MQNARCGRCVPIRAARGLRGQSALSVDIQAAARARDLLDQAPLEPDRWPDFLDALAVATGSQGAQLVGVGDGGLIFDITRGVPEEALQQMAAAGGFDGASPLMRATQAAPLRTLLSEDTLLIGEALEAWRRLRDSTAMAATPHTAFAIMRREGDERLSLVLYRTAAQGPLRGEAATLFSELLPGVVSAVELQARINGRAALAASAAVDALGHAAFVCDAWGRVLAASEAGARLAEEPNAPVAVRRRRLAFRSLKAGVAEAAMRAAANGTLTGPQLLVTTDTPPHVIEVHGLPHNPLDHGEAPACLVIVRPDTRVRTSLDRAEPALTSAERAVALLLLQGESTRDIAEARHTSVETVRGQIKSIYAKLGAASRSEFMARFR